MKENIPSYNVRSEGTQSKEIIQDDSMHNTETKSNEKLGGTTSPQPIEKTSTKDKNYKLANLIEHLQSWINGGIEPDVLISIAAYAPGVKLVFACLLII